MVLMHLSLLVLIEFADLSLGMLMLHLFTMDPAWVRPRRAAGETLSHARSEDRLASPAKPATLDPLGGVGGDRKNGGVRWTRRCT